MPQDSRTIWAAILLLAVAAGCRTEPAPAMETPKAVEPASPAAAPSSVEATRAGRSAAVAPGDAARLAMPRPRATGGSETPHATEPVRLQATTADRLLRTTTAWCRPRGPMTISVERAAGAKPLSLQVLDRDGRSLAEISVVPGETNLLALAPAIRDAERTLWLQLMEGDAAVGQPMWITPMRAPPPVRTVRSIRTTNQQPYTRVVGWGDRAIDPSDPETAQAMPSWTPPDPVITGGFRVEPAEDAILHTSAGDLRVAFAPDAAPATVDNFLRLARAGFYDGTLFHRVVPLDRDGRPFVVQGGDPTGTGDGGPGWNLALEPSDLPHDRGVLGMARGDDPDSAGSQFYMGLSREGTARLDVQYCTFGVVIDGWPTLEALAATPIGDPSTGRPKDPPVLLRVELVPAAPRLPGVPARPTAAVRPSSTPAP